MKGFKNTLTIKTRSAVFTAAILALSTLLLYFNGIIGFGALKRNTAAAAETFGNADTSTITRTEESGAHTFVFENEIMKTTLGLPSGGGVKLTSIKNKEANNREMLAQDSSSETRLFKYIYAQYRTANYRELKSDDAGLKVLKESEGGFGGNGFELTEIIMKHTDNVTTTVVGHKLAFWVGKDDCPLQVRMEFEIYNDRSGMKYQTWIRNTSETLKFTIAESNVIELGFKRPAENYVLHYPQNQMWKYVENGVIDPHWQTIVTSSSRKDLSTARNIIAVVNEGPDGYGWYVAPESNWQTQNGPEIPGNQGNTDYTYPFTSINAYSGINNVCIFTNPGSVQLTLFPEEVFEYIDVNFTVFKAQDYIDGKMAVEEHLRKRFRFNDTNLIINTNDWDWLGNARIPNYYQDVIVPKAKLAGLEMVMMDDLWNTTRDSVEVIEELYDGDMKGWADWIDSMGFKVGLWYSLIGDDHNNGRDLADPEQLAAKQAQIEYLINEYHLDHQMIDLTEFWQTTFDTSYSHVGDSVYRKNKLVRQMLNGLVEKYPWYMVKYTNEMDVYPTQGDRNTDLGHLINNGWLVIAGDAAGDAFRQYTTTFGHQPMNTVYTGGNPDGSLERYYGLMIGRNAKFSTDPGTWSNDGSALLGKFNAWRRTEKIDRIVNNIMRPVYFGKNWTDYKTWDPYSGPYAWGWFDENKDEGLVIASAVQKTPHSKNITGDFRWVDTDKTYVITDITLDKYGNQVTRYMGTYSGTELAANGYEIDLSGGAEACRAYWIQSVVAAEGEVVTAYENDNILSADISVSGGKIVINATGKPSSTGIVTLAQPSGRKGLGVSVKFPANGSTTVEVPLEKLTDSFVTIPFPPSVNFSANDARLGAAGAMTYTKNSTNGGIAAIPDSSNTGMYLGSFAIGDYVEFSLSAAQRAQLNSGGTYIFNYGFEAHTENRGKAKFEIYANGNKILTTGEQTLIGGSKAASIKRMGKLTLPDEALASVNIRMILASADDKTPNLTVMNFRFDPSVIDDAITIAGMPERACVVGDSFDLTMTCHDVTGGIFDFDNYMIEVIESDFGVINLSILASDKIKMDATAQGTAFVTFTNKQYPLLDVSFTVTVSAITGVEVTAPEANKITVTGNPASYKHQMSATVQAPSGTKDLSVLWVVTDKDGNKALSAEIDSVSGELILTGNGEIMVTAVAQDGSAKRHSVTITVEGFGVIIEDVYVRDSAHTAAAAALFWTGLGICILGAAFLVLQLKFKFI